jgi:three-Cys-motif partner protein
MQQFGGRWTEEKLAQLRKYLHAYMVLMTKNPRAAYFRKVYFDAFAGSGVRTDKASAPESHDLLLVEPPDSETVEFLKGSARVALETEPAFDQYIFVEKNPEYAARLDELRSTFPQLSDRIVIVPGDANDLLARWCRTTDWKKTRAVVFLDPYGMQVDWATIEAIAKTKAIDLWILFPLGQGVNRLLTREGPPPAAWADRLTRFFGTDEWRSRFYRQTEVRDLFGSTFSLIEKDADFEAIGAYFLERLRSVFCRVAERTLPLRNSKGTPIFLLCFAAGNEKGAPTAVKIANDIMNAWGRRKK